ncbi:hypothetical protein [Kineosporia sp. R_H_3]|uniref:hypothetical protein n=1 Tax=Kineosporia sp. R_H_3 TaxID=1961848 RepID=UPI001303F658|nr:hypothetical protein [Kineosporia sp. R_H_3]
MAETTALLRFLVEHRDKRGRFVDVWGMAVALVCERRDAVRGLLRDLTDGIAGAL